MIGMPLFNILKGGVHFGKDFLSFAVVKEAGKGVVIRGCGIVELPKEAVRPSPVDSNVSSSDEIRTCFKNFFLEYPRLKSLALSLPDLSARMIVVEIKGKTPPPAELNQLIKWNMEQKFIMKIGESRIASQKIRTSNRSPGPSLTYFGVAIQKSILSEYEKFPHYFNRLAKMINCASLGLFNLYRHFIERSAPSGNFLFLSVLDCYFTLMVFENSDLAYVRTVALRSEETGNGGAGASPEELNRLKLANHIESVFPYHFQEFQTRSDIKLFISGLAEIPEELGQLAEQYRMNKDRKSVV